LIKQQEYWQPAYVVEQDADGNYVVFLPDTPDTNTGHVLLAKQDQVRIVSSLTANQLDASLMTTASRGACPQDRGRDRHAVAPLWGEPWLHMWREGIICARTAVLPYVNAMLTQ
jgi:hypothetical protein